MAYADDGKALLNNLVLGTGVGASATGLYYLAKKLRKQFEEQLEKNKPQAPDYADAALEVPNLTPPEQKKLAALDPYTVATPLATGAAGAILAAALSDKKTKKRNALLGGAAGALAGAGLNTKPVHEFIGRNAFPTGYLSWALGGDHGGETKIRNGWKSVMLPAGAGLGALAGKTLYDISAAPYVEAEKKKEQYGAVESARQKYFNELLHDGDDSDDKKEKRSAIDETLDAVYDACAEKEAGIMDVIRSGADTIFTKGTYNPLAYLTLPFRAAGTGLDMYNTAFAAATLGGGLLGSKYMYDKTRSESSAKNMAKAIAAKERMKQTLPVWVDPQELAQVKDVAKAKEQTDEGV